MAKVMVREEVSAKVENLSIALRDNEVDSARQIALELVDLDKPSYWELCLMVDLLLKALPDDGHKRLVLELESKIIAHPSFTHEPLEVRMGRVCAHASLLLTVGEVERCRQLIHAENRSLSSLALPFLREYLSWINEVARSNGHSEVLNDIQALDCNRSVAQ